MALAGHFSDLVIAKKNEEEIPHVKQVLNPRFEVKNLNKVQSQYSTRIIRQSLDKTSPAKLIFIKLGIIHKLVVNPEKITFENQKS